MALNYSFSGKRVLVTGAGRGIGFQIAKSFYDDGATVFIIDKESGLLENVKQVMPNAQTFCLDLLDWEQTRETVESLAPLDHVVNNAGFVFVKNLIDSTPEDFDKIFGINVKAILNVSNAFVKGIIAKKQSSGGTIVNISSVADRMITRGGGVGLYTATKSSVTSLTKSMAAEYHVYNVRVNCVCPGLVHTDMIADAGEPFITHTVQQVESRQLFKNNPITTQDIANQVLFLSSPLAAKCTGAAFVVDSGLSL